MAARSKGWVKLAALDVGAWTILALFFAAQGALANAYRGRPTDWAATIAYSLSFYSIWAALTPAVVWLAGRVAFERRLRFFAVHVACGVAASLLHAALFAVIFWPSYSDSPAHLFGSMLFTQFHTNLVLYWVVVGGVVGVGYYRKYRERELRAARLETRLARAEIEALRAQFQPHFLFNALNTVSALVRDEPLAAERTLARLGDLLRIALDSHPAEMVPLGQELEFVDRYLDVEQARFGDRLRVERDIDPKARSARVPYLVLQPLVENALRHGVAARRAGATVTLRAALRGERLRLEVADDGNGPARRPIEEGVGLGNTRARLELLFGAAQSFDVRAPTGGGFAVAIEIPAGAPS